MLKKRVFYTLLVGCMFLLLGSMVFPSGTNYLTSETTPEEIYSESSEVPVLNQLGFSTYIGGAVSNDYAYSITTDSEGYIYVAGHTSGRGFPLVNPVDSIVDPPQYPDIFVLKMTPEGDDLVFSTFLGGNSHESFPSIAVDEFGCVYITGRTRSSDFPVMNALYPTHSGYYDSFLTKLDPSGNMLFSTYLGGSGGDGAKDIALDSDGNIYLTGSTGSSDYPVVNGYQETFGGQSDIFVTKVNPDGSELIYSTYIGVWAGEYGYALDVDESGNVYVTGSVASYSGFSTPGAYDETHNGYYDAFVLKLNSTGTGIDYCTYVGGGDGPGSGVSGEEEWGESIVVDTSGCVYVTGMVVSPNFPTVNAYDDTHGGGGPVDFYDAFVFKLNQDGSDLIYSTFLGGAKKDYGEYLAIDDLGNAYVTGWTYSLDFPVSNAFDDSHNGEVDAFVTVLNATGNGLVSSTFIGGSAIDEGESICIEDSGSILVTGHTRSLDFPLANPYDAVNDPYGDCFILRLEEEKPDYPDLNITSQITNGNGTAIESFDVISLQSDKTYPESFFYDISITNTWMETIESLTVDISVHEDWALKSEEKLMVYLDGIEITDSVQISNTTITLTDIPIDGIVDITACFKYAPKNVEDEKLKDFEPQGYWYKANISSTIQDITLCYSTSSRIVSHLKNAETIGGFVLNADNTPRLYSNVELYHADGTKLETDGVDAGGFFFFTGLDEGSYTLVAFIQGDNGNTIANLYEVVIVHKDTVTVVNFIYSG